MACSQTKIPIKILECCSCHEIPWTEVFQCSNAHLICDKCYSTVKICPQCKTKLEQKVKIRSAMEHILNSRDFDCPQKEQGCGEKLARNMVSNHIKQKCTYRTVQPCKLVGYDCEFSVSPSNRNVIEAVQHFQKEHGALLQDSRSFTISLKVVTSKDRWFASQNYISSPVIVQSEKSGGTFLLFGKTNGKEKTMEMKFWFFGDSTSVKNPCSNFQLCLNPASNSKLTWTEFPTGIWDSDNLFKSESFKIPLRLLNREILDNRNFLVNVVISKLGETVEFRQEKERLIETDIDILDLASDGPHYVPKPEVGPFSPAYKCDKCFNKFLKTICFVSLTSGSYYGVLCSSCIDENYDSEIIYAVITSERQAKVFRTLAFDMHDRWTTVFSDTIQSQHSRLPKVRQRLQAARQSTSCPMTACKNDPPEPMQCRDCKCNILGYPNYIENCTVKFHNKGDIWDDFDDSQDESFVEKMSHQETSFDPNNKEENTSDKNEYLRYLKLNRTKRGVKPFYTCLECYGYFMCSDCASSGCHSERNHILALISQKTHLAHFQLDGGKFLRRIISLISKTIDD